MQFKPCSCCYTCTQVPDCIAIISLNYNVHIISRTKALNLPKHIRKLDAPVSDGKDILPLTFRLFNVVVSTELHDLIKIINNKWMGICKKVVMGYLRVLSLQLSGEAEENHEKPHSVQP
jgi:hypothetical protein